MEINSPNASAQNHRDDHGYSPNVRSERLSNPEGFRDESVPNEFDGKGREPEKIAVKSVSLGANPISPQAGFVPSEIEIRPPVVRNADDPNKTPFIRTNGIQSVSPNEPITVSTNGRPSLVLIKPDGVRSQDDLQNVGQKGLVESPNETWKWLNGTDKPPLPDRHVVNPKGKRKFGRKTLTGYEILRKAHCVCGGESRLSAGYISASAIYEMMGEDHETQIGTIRQILRKRAGEVDLRLVGVRCAACRAGSQIQDQGIAEVG